MTNDPATTRGRALRIALAVLGIVWAALWVRRFWHTNPALWSDANPAGDFGVFSALGGPWSFSWEHSPPLVLLQSGIVLALAQTLGLLLLRALRIGSAAIGRHAMAFTLGFGASGIAFELLTMAHGLRTPLAWLLWALLLGAGWWAARRFGAPSPKENTEAPEGAAKRVLFSGGVVLVATMSLLSLWHGLFYPETYWDSLILYLGYARMMFLEHAFPFKAEAQVGIGLGANYPHLFAQYGAMASTLWGEWTDVHQRLAAPVAGIAATALLYDSVRVAFRSRLAGITAALFFRMTPNAIAYTAYASDYAFSLLFAAALLHAAVTFARLRTRGALVLLFAIPAIAMHLNYLMVTFWGPAVLVALAATRGAASAEIREHNFWVPLWKSRFAWGAFAVLFLAGSTWYIRNAVLTGNPVYSFFPNVFTASVRVNPEVLRSAELEWFRNGDGIARLAELTRDIRNGEERRTEDPGYRRTATVADRIAASWWFWGGYETFRRQEDGGVIRGVWRDRLAELVVPSPPEREPQRPYRVSDYMHAYKMNPVFMGFLLPGCIAAFVLWRRDRRERNVEALLLAAAVLGIGLTSYMYLLADFYLYQIVPVTVAFAALSAATVPLLERAASRGVRRVLGGAFAALVALSSLVPGVAMSLMNFKFKSSAVVGGQRFSQITLDAFRNPGLPGELFYRLEFGETVELWQHVNATLHGERILTHENRHYLLDPSIVLVHLDDWEMQKLWGLPPEKLAAALRERGIRWYWRTPNEARHPILRRMGMESLEAGGFLAARFRRGEDTLFELTTPN